MRGGIDFDPKIKVLPSWETTIHDVNQGNEEGVLLLKEVLSFSKQLF